MVCGYHFPCLRKDAEQNDILDASDCDMDEDDGTETEEMGWDKRAVPAVDSVGVLGLSF